MSSYSFAMWKKLRNNYRFRVDPVPGTAKRSWHKGCFYKHPKTTQERRKNEIFDNQDILNFQNEYSNISILLENVYDFEYYCNINRIADLIHYGSIKNLKIPHIKIRGKRLNLPNTWDDCVRSDVRSGHSWKKIKKNKKQKQWM